MPEYETYLTCVFVFGTKGERFCRRCTWRWICLTTYRSSFNLQQAGGAEVGKRLADCGCVFFVRHRKQLSLFLSFVNENRLHVALGCFWLCMVRYFTVPSYFVRYYMVRYDVILHYMVRCNTVRYYMVRYSMVDWSAVLPHTTARSSPSHRGHAVCLWILA